MDDRRLHNRLTTQRTIEVFDQHSGRYLGRVVDLSEDGFMLVSDTPPETDSVWQCRLVLDQPLEGIEQIHLGADCLWSRTEQGHSGWSGFQIIDLADDQAAALAMLLRQL